MKSFRPRLLKPHKQGWSAHPQYSGSRHERGYDSDWEELRNAFIQENPFCKHCDEQGDLTPASQVDHIVAFQGKDDPLRLDWNNLQSLCNVCHRRKTSRTRHSNKRTRLTNGPPR